MIATHPEDQSMSDNLFPLVGALLFAGLFAGLSAINRAWIKPTWTILNAF